MVEQKKALAEARALAKKKKFQKALDKVREVSSSDLRIGSFWDDAVNEAAKLARKAEKAK